ncbi:hypothetical protein ACLB2K_052601 [Fragaria x ananassa]
MNILVWNCQGIVNSRIRHALKLLVQSHQVHMVFLSETLCTTRQHASLRRAIGFPYMVCFDRVDHAVGLALLWEDSIRVSVRAINFFYIDVDVSGLEDVNWRFTGFYGHPDTGQRQLLGSLAFSVQKGSGKMVGCWFTWSKSNTKERLDQGVCTPAWMISFSHSRVRVLPPSRSDHVPLLLEVHKDRPACDQEKRPYRFEEFWCADPDFPRVLENA